MDETTSQTILAVSIIAAVGIFVGSRIWMLFRK
jgi:hypothetical protein